MRLFGFCARSICYPLLVLIILIFLYIFKINSQWSLFDHFKEDLQIYISSELKVPVKFDSANENFKDFNYTLSFEEIIIGNQKIKDVEIHIDIIKSFRNGKPYIKKIDIFNPELIFLKDEYGVFLDGHKYKNKDKIKIPYYIYNFFEHTDIHLNNLKISTKEEKKETVNIDNFNAKIKTKDEKIIIKFENSNVDNFFVNLTLSDEDIYVDAKGEFNYLNKIIDNTPLIKYSKYIDKNWDIKGDIGVFAYVNFLKKNNFKVDISFLNNEIIFNNAKKLKLSDVIGLLEVNPKNKYILTANAKAKFYGNTQDINLILDEKNNIKIESYGYANLSLINNWLNNDFVNDLEGGSIFRTEINLSKDINNIVIKSDLKGIESYIPYPFSKEKDESVNFIFSIDINTNNAFVHFNDHNLKINNENNKIKSILVGLNQLTPKNIKKGIAIEGEIDSFDIAEIINYINNKTENKNNNYLFINKINIDSKKIKYKSQEIINSNFNMILDEKNNEYSIELNSEEIEVKALIDLKNKSYIADISKLDYIVKDNSLNDIPSQFKDYKILKNGKIRIQDFSINEEKLSDVTIEIPQNNNDNLFEIFLTSVYQNTSLNLMINYDYEKNITSISPLEGDSLLSGENIYEFTSRTNPKSPAKSSEFYLKGRLSWKGDPLSFKINSLNGNIYFYVKDIEIKGLKEDYLSMKIFNIFNFDNLFKMLSFDFELLSNKELNLDDIHINYSINNGIMSSEKFELNGDEISLKMEGIINLKDELIDKKVEIIVPVTDKISGLSLLAGASPQTAGIIFLIDKLIGDELNKMFKAKFRLYGDFKNTRFEKL